jgi:hypothetical protein
MTETRFKVSRANGQTDAQVLCGLVSTRQPGDVLTYDEISSALGADTERSFDKPTVQSVVARTLVTVGKQIQRALHNVRGVGYRIAPANDHRMISMERKRKADKQLLKGLRVLQNVRWDELTPAAKEAHEGQLMLLGSVVQMQRQTDARLSRLEELIANRNGKA